MYSHKIEQWKCKKGKANDKGKASGTDTCEAEFKSGLPDGEGTYN